MQEQCCFDHLSPGAYQLVLHRDTQHGTLKDSANFAIKLWLDNDSKSAVMDRYYSAMYDAFEIITTKLVPVTAQNSCLQVQFVGLPAGLKYAQLQKVELGSMVITSPQWVHTAPSFEIDWSTCAGSSHNGDYYWVSLRLGVHPELGRFGFDGRFLYGRHGSYREECAAHATFQGRAGHPAALVNLQQFEWVTITFDAVYKLASRAVVLGSAQDWTMHAARVLFCGWDEQALKHDRQHVMTSSGPVIAVLPGKLEFSKAGAASRAMFTWEGKATGGPDIRVGDNQEVQILCYHVLK